MLTASEWLTFLTATTALAVLPGPGILYVLARSFRGGRLEGARSAAGTGLGALVHVVAAALGLSAVLATSATAFTLIKFAGAAYLVYLGVRTLLERGRGADPTAGATDGERRSALVQGVVTEVFNPKTALFFLAFIPQFVHAERGMTAVMFLVLGLIFVVLTTGADLLVALFAGPLADRLASNPRWNIRQRVTSGLTMIGLGGVLAIAERH